MSSGYSGKPLAVKLGVKPGMRVKVVDAPRPYDQIVANLPTVQLGQAETDPVDFIHFFTREHKRLQDRLEEFRGRIHPNGMIWVSWPKKSSGVPTDLTEDRVREAALAVGLVDVKVCAVDEVWSGLKLVIRVADRG